MICKTQALVKRKKDCCFRIACCDVNLKDHWSITAAKKCINRKNHNHNDTNCVNKLQNYETCFQWSSMKQFTHARLLSDLTGFSNSEA